MKKGKEWRERMKWQNEERKRKTGNQLGRKLRKEEKNREWQIDWVNEG